MKIQLYDPRLTAYALDEMNEKERAAFESLLKQDPDAQREADAIRATTEMLVEELAKEPLPALSSEQRREVYAASRQEDFQLQAVPRRKRRWLRGLAVAASLLFVLGALAAIIVPSLQSAQVSPFTYSLDGSTENRPFQTADPTVPKPEPPKLEPSSPRERNVRADFADSVSDFVELDASRRKDTKQFHDPTVTTQSDNDADGTPPVSPEMARQLASLGYVDENEVYRKAVAARLGMATSTPGTEAYGHFIENRFLAVRDEPLSTFSIDVDTAAYANVRRFLNEGSLPPVDVVRIEELLNYFKYDYPRPRDEIPFSVNVEINPCPWSAGNLLARVGLQGKNVPMDDRPPCNLVFLLDVSGSMDEPNKLPLLVKGMEMLTNALAAKDRIGIVTYCETPRVVLEPTACEEKPRILFALGQLRASGSTNGEGGIRLAYEVARRSFLSGGINRVVLATDGDFNVGMDQTSELVRLIESEAKSGVFLNVLGFGTGNLKDTNLQGLADRGNGQYAYIDSFNEVRRVLLDKIGGTLVTIAKDVKIQVEFNPAKVGAYRLIGYEKRALAAKDFNDDTKDAGEIGAGHTVTALYELVPAGKPMPSPSVDALKYQPNETPPPSQVPASASSEMMTVKLRYKAPNSDTSTRFDVPVESVGTEPSPDFQFAAGVAAFGMALRHSEFKGSANLDMALDLAQQGKGTDPDGARAGFLDLVKTAKALGRL